MSANDQFTKPSWLQRVLFGATMFLLAIGLVACRPITATSPENASTEPVTPVPADLLETPPTVAPEIIDSTVVPVAIEIPAIGLQTSVEPMLWEITLVNDERTTRWVVPGDAAGWAPDSAGAGEAGNTIIVGHQMLGDAVFRPLALDAVAPDQDIFLTGSDGVVYHYRIVEVSAPLPTIGATPDELEQAMVYVASTNRARLTLLTGWPVDVSTHRLFVVADFVGEDS